MKKESKTELIWDVYDYYMHPILGYKWKQPAINSHKRLKHNEYNNY